MDLVEFNIKGKPPNQVVQVVVDQPGGIKLDVCVRLDRKISDQIDSRLEEMGPYRLEISSPGIDRPLKTKRDFERNINHCVCVYLNDKRQSIEGKIAVVTETTLFVETNEGQVDIPVQSIDYAKVQIEW